MRPLYLLLYFSLSYSLNLFYRSIKSINRPKKRFGGTIYISNHPNSFMDPLVIGEGNHAIVYFMTRSDVFKWWLQPILWASHMLPIFRQHDGEDTKTANSDTFRQVNESLAKGRNILIFGEGFTDDVPIRSLKPVKKGGVRMGFHALEATGWKKTISIAAVGVNYTDRNTIGSDYLIANSDPICLNDYKEAYLQHPSKVINELTKMIEQRMQETITYVKDKSWAPFHENIMIITRKGMNHPNFEKHLSLEERWQYSKQLASWLNEQSAENEALVALKKDLESYFGLLKRMKLEDRFVLAKKRPELVDRTSDLLVLLFLWPLAIVGLIHGLIPYLVVKKFTEKSFRRKVFWGSVKMMLGKLFGAIYNVPLILLLNYYVFPSNWIGLVYFFVIPALCYVAWIYVRAFKSFRLKGMMKKADVSKFAAKRDELEQRIHALIPVA